MPAPYPYPPTATDAPTNPWAAVVHLQSVVGAAHVVLCADGPSELLADALTELRAAMAQLHRLCPELVPELPPTWARRIAEAQG